MGVGVFIVKQLLMKIFVQDSGRNVLDEMMFQSVTDVSLS